jgi:hypothetical protein
MVIVASVYLRFYTKVGVGTVLPTPAAQPCYVVWVSSEKFGLHACNIKFNKQNNE